MVNKFKAHRWLAAAVGGVMMFSMVYAFAATLGLASNNLSAGTQTVAACDTDGVLTAYTTDYDGTIPGYRVHTVTISGIAAACNGQNFSVTLTSSSGTVLGEVSQANAELGGSGDAMTLALDFSGQHVSAASVEKLFVSITGPVA